MRFLKKSLLIFAGIIALIALAIALLHTDAIQSRVFVYIQNYVQENYDLRIEASRLDYRLLPRVHVRIQNFRLYGGEKNQSVFLDAKEISMDSPLSILWSSNRKLDKITLNRPHVDLDSIPRIREQPEEDNGGTFEIGGIQITGGGAVLSGNQLQDIELDASLGRDELNIRRLTARFADAILNAKGRLYNFEALHADLDYSIEGNAALISRFVKQAPALEGAVSGSGKIEGPVTEFKATGNIDANSVRLNQSSPFSLQGNYTLLRKGEEDFSIDTRVQWNDFPLSAIHEYTPSAPVIASLSDGTLTYSGGMDYWRGQGSISAQIAGIPNGKGLPLSGAVEGNLENGVFNLKPSSLQFRRITVNLNGRFTESSVDADVIANIPNASDLAVLSPELTKVPGSFKVNAHVSGQYNDPVIEAKVAGTGPTLLLNADGSIRPRFQQLDLKFDAAFDQRLLRPFYQGDLKGNFQTDGSASGSWNAPVLSANLKGSGVEFQNVPIGEIETEVQSDGRTLQVNAQLPDMNGKIAGSYGWNTGNFEASGNIENLTQEKIKTHLPEQLKTAELNISADFNARGNAKRWRHLTGEVVIKQAEISKDDLTIVVEPGSTIRAQNQIVTADLRGSSKDTTASIKGNYSLANKSFDASGNLNNLEIQTLQPLLPESIKAATGVVNADFRIDGDADRWKEANGELVIHQAEFQLNKLNVAIQKESRVLIRNGIADVSLALQMPEGNLDVTGSAPLDQRGPVNLNARGTMNLNMIQLVAPQIETGGEARIDLNVRGTIQDPQISGTIAANNAFVRLPEQKIAIEGATFQGNLTGESLELQATGTLNNAPMELKGIVPLSATERGQVNFSLQSFAPSTLAPEANLSGTIDVNIQAEGTGFKPQDWGGKAEISTKELYIGEVPVQTDGPIRATFSDRAIEVEPFRIRAKDEMDISGAITTDLRSKTISGSIQSVVNLSLISEFVPDLGAHGSLVIDVQASGSLTDPELNGTVHLEDGAIRIPNYPIILENIQFHAPFTENRLTIDAFQATMGGGTVTGSGGVELHNWKPTDVKISLAGRTIGLEYPDDLRSQINFDLTFSSQEKGYLLSGDVGIIRSLYESDIDYRDRLVNTLLSQKKALATAKRAISEIALDLQVKTIQDLRVRNNVARLRAGANLEVTGDVDTPRLSGRIEIREGSIIYFEGNQFEVERGIIDFLGTREFNPRLDIQLFAVVQARTPPSADESGSGVYEVTLPLSGTLDDLDYKSPSSFPQLSTDQIYSLLLTGSTESSLGQAGSEFFQRQLASYITGQLFFDVEQQLAGAFGLSRVEIQPELIASERDPSARLVVGKDITSQFGIIYSVSLTDSEDQTWIANYRLARNFSLRFIDQASDSYTAGLRHSFRFGPGYRRPSRSGRGGVVLERINTFSLENESALTTEKIHDIVGSIEGERYDYWDLFDSITKIKEKLQDLGYLFPEVELQETPAGQNKVNLKLRIVDRGLRSMVFRGVKLEKGQLKKFNAWWREGFSEMGILEQIRDDILRELRIKGHFRASVNYEKQEPGGRIVYDFVVEPGIQYTKQELRFAGANRYTGDDLRKDLRDLYESTEEVLVDAIYRRRVVIDRIQALYFQKGFLDTEVEMGAVTFEADNTVARQIIIREGPQSNIENLEISGSQEFPGDLQAKLKLREGSTYDPRGLNEDLLAIGEYYEDHGYPHVDVESSIHRVPGKPGLTLTYNLNTGELARIRNIRIEGNERTRLSVIKKRVPFKPGEILTQEKLTKAQRNLYNSRLFYQVTVESEQTSTPGEYDVVVKLVEIQKYQTIYGLRYDTEKNLEGEAQIQDTSLFGTANSLSLYTRVNTQDRILRLIYNSPPASYDNKSPTALRWSTLISAGYEREERETFTVTSRIFTYQKQFELTGPFFVIGDYTFENLITESTLIGLPVRIKRNLSQVGATLVADTRDDPINASRGYFLSFGNQYSPDEIGSDIPFTRLFYQAFYFKKFGRIVWASGARVGVAYTDLIRLPESERFFAGGSSTLRGFELDTVGPRLFGIPEGGEAVMIINQELRFPVYKWFGGAVFYDGGNVYSKPGDLSFSDIRHSAGIGLRLNSPFGVVRFDWGLNLDPQFDEGRSVIHIGIGQAF